MWKKLLPLLHRQRANPMRPVSEDTGDHEDEPPRGCGWFDSSHELTRGLCVRELAEPAVLARELPLPAWIDWQLAACTATHSAASA